MAKVKKEPVNCLYCESFCSCVNPCETTEQLIYRLEAELQRQRTRYKYPGIWNREAAKVEELKIKERLEKYGRH
jgi:hypothetical protein